MSRRLVGEWQGNVCVAPVVPLQRGLPLPPRPAIPTALWALACSCACQLAIARASMGGDEWLAQLLVMGATGCCAMALAGAWLTLRLHRAQNDGSRQLVAAVLTCALCAAASACLCASRGLQTAAQLQSSAISGWHFEVLSDSSHTDTGYRCRARAYRESSPPGDVWLLTQEACEQGTIISCIGRFRALRQDDYGISSWCQGVRGSVTAVRVLGRQTRGGPLQLVRALRAQVVSWLQVQRSESRALLAGCLCGSRAALDACGLTETFATCGLSHMVAVSGAHLATVVLLVSALLDRLQLRIRLKLVLLGILTGLFVLYCGCPISAVRAWLMLVIGYAAQLAGRRVHAITAVSLVALAMILVDATVVGQLGFQLSVLCVVGLCLYTQHAGYVIRSLAAPLRMPRFVTPHVRRLVDAGRDQACQMLAATLVCQLVTMPLCVSVFGQVSLVAPLASLVAGPAMGVFMGLGLCACVLMWLPPAAALLLAVCDALAASLLLMLHSLARLPCAAVSSEAFGIHVGAVAVLLLVIWLVWWPRVNQRRARMACAMLALTVLLVYAYWRCLAPARIVVLDVGQGDAILVQDGTKAVLVDTGPDEAVAAALARRHVMHLDAVVLTHLHDDHYGGLQYLVGTIGCTQVLVARGVVEALPDELADTCAQLTDAPVAELSYGDSLAVGGFSLRMIWPHQAVDGDENSESLQLLVSYWQHGSSLTALLTGDAEQDELAACIRSGDVGDLDVLKLGHHGSEVSLTAEEARAIKAELAIASAGEGNRYGHPTQACIDALATARVRFLCTKDAGDVEVLPAANGMRVRTYPDG